MDGSSFGAIIEIYYFGLRRRDATTRRTKGGGMFTGAHPTAVGTGGKPYVTDRSGSTYLAGVTVGVRRRQCAESINQSPSIGVREVQLGHAPSSSGVVGAVSVFKVLARLTHSNLSLDAYRNEVFHWASP